MPPITPFVSLAPISGSNIRPIPVTQSGGTKATAIATPAIVLAIFLRVRENAPAVPAAIAIQRSIRFGVVLVSISEPSILTGSTDVIAAEVTITTTTPIIKVAIERRIRTVFPIVMP